MPRERHDWEVLDVRIGCSIIVVVTFNNFRQTTNRRRQQPAATTTRMMTTSTTSICGSNWPKRTTFKESNWWLGDPEADFPLQHWKLVSDLHVGLYIRPLYPCSGFKYTILPFAILLPLSILYNLPFLHLWGKAYFISCKKIGMS